MDDNKESIAQLLDEREEYRYYASVHGKEAEHHKFHANRNYEAIREIQRKLYALGYKGY